MNVPAGAAVAPGGGVDTGARVLPGARVAVRAIVAAGLSVAPGEVVSNDENNVRGSTGNQPREIRKWRKMWKWQRARHNGPKVIVLVLDWNPKGVGGDLPEEGV